MIADGKDTQTINLGLKPDGKVRLLEVVCTFITSFSLISFIEK
jgi:hypothetical protein